MHSGALYAIVLPSVCLSVTRVDQSCLKLGSCNFHHRVNNNDLPRLQRDSRDLFEIIQYLETTELPKDSRMARAIVSDADNWCLINNILYHIYNVYSSRVGVNMGPIAR